MDTIGDRIKKERERLRYSQTAFGEAGGVKKLAQINYEKGSRLPDAGYLKAIADIGADVQYIITGVPSLAGCIAAQQKREEQAIREGMTPRVGDLPKLTVGENVAHSDTAGISQREAALLDNYRARKEEDQMAIERVALKAAAPKQVGVVRTPQRKRASNKNKAK